MIRTIVEKPVFNREDLMERLDHDHFLAVELAKLFIIDAETRLASLGKVIDSGATEKIENEAHSLKGAASNLAAEKVRAIASLIETAAKNNDMENIMTGKKLLIPAIDELIDVLKFQLMPETS